MVAKVGKQENGDRAYNTIGLNKRRQIRTEKEEALRLKEHEHYTS
jgi:hypothetical protein